MFEINLVPDVKGELLKKQKQRNLIIFVSIVVAIASAAVVALLGSIVAGQNIALSNQDREIECRSEGTGIEGDCGTRYGTAVLKFANLNEYLTIQDQMDKISLVNGNKMMLSRVFGLLDVILPSYESGDQDDVKISELAVNLPEATLSFDAVGNSLNNIDYRALEVFKNIAVLSYYDHGRYMRYDEEQSSFVEIPAFCVDEPAAEIVDGVVYGVYHKGAPGCEAPMLMTGQEETEVVDVRIKRSYATSAEREEYMAENNEVGGGRYYFESECIAYGENGRFDEEGTRLSCQLSANPPAIRDSSNTRDSDGNLALRFSASVVLNKEVFRFANKHMMIVGPTRQNVTDSYIQIRDMFVEPPEECAPDDIECLQEVPNGS